MVGSQVYSGLSDLLSIVSALYLHLGENWRILKQVQKNTANEIQQNLDLLNLYLRKIYSFARANIRIAILEIAFFQVEDGSLER